jgi:hypothetical protein
MELWQEFLKLPYSQVLFVFLATCAIFLVKIIIWWLFGISDIVKNQNRIITLIEKQNVSLHNISTNTAKAMNSINAKLDTTNKKQDTTNDILEDLNTKWE